MFNAMDYLKPDEIAWYLLLDQKDRETADKIIYIRSLGKKKGTKLLNKIIKDLEGKGQNV